MPTTLRVERSAPKRATNVSLDEMLLSEAKALHINVSKAAEEGLARAIKDKRIEAWLRDNQATLDSSNAYVETHGLPLARYRQF
jgi:antitoxin CcdA